MTTNLNQRYIEFRNEITKEIADLLESKGINANKGYEIPKKDDYYDYLIHIYDCNANAYYDCRVTKVRIDNNIDIKVDANEVIYEDMEYFDEPIWEVDNLMTIYNLIYDNLCESE